MSDSRDCPQCGCVTSVKDGDYFICTVCGWEEREAE